MKKSLLILLTAFSLSVATLPSAFAGEKEDSAKEYILVTAQDYILDAHERPKARRSALVAHILDSMVGNDNLAAAQEYILDTSEHPKARRSALVAHILESMAANKAMPVKIGQLLITDAGIQQD